MLNLQNRASKLFLLLTLIWVSCQSCFQFRKSDKKQLKILEEVQDDYIIKLGHKSGLDRQIHYTYVGDSSDRPLVIFIHGSPGSSSNFIHFAKDTSLLKYYNVLLLDRPGFGYSDFGKSEPDMLRQASILNEVVNQFGSQKKVLVGHSLGGPIIANMAMKKPDDYYGLLIVAGSVSPELEPEEKWRKPMNSPALRWLMPKSFCVSNQEILPAKEKLMEMESDWPLVKSNVQIIQGGEDKLVPPGNDDYAKKMLVNAKQVRVYRLPEEDHFIPFTEPQLIREALMKF